MVAFDGVGVNVGTAIGVGATVGGSAGVGVGVLVMLVVLPLGFTLHFVVVVRADDDDGADAARTPTRASSATLDVIFIVASIQSRDA